MAIVSPTWLLCLLALFLCHGFQHLEASHKVYTNLQASQSISVEQPYRTSYHFQPPKNWINGMVYLLIFLYVNILYTHTLLSLIIFPFCLFLVCVLFMALKSKLIVDIFFILVSIVDNVVWPFGNGQFGVFGHAQIPTVSIFFSSFFLNHDLV